MAKEDISLRLSLIDGVSRQLADIRKNVNDLGTSIIKINAAAELTGKAFGAVSAAGNFLGGQITSVGNFEQSLLSLRAVTGASAEELEKLKNAAIAASQASIFSSTEAADGLTELARAGFDATEAISSLNPVLALAQGQQLSVAESSQFVTTTLTQFGLAAAEAGRVADVLASAADKSSTDVRQLGLALSYAAPIAQSAGMSLEETTAIIGKLADAGFRGERGGTALANVLSALADPSSKFSEALDKAGIKTRDFTEVMEALKNKGADAGSILLELDTTARPAILSMTSKGSAGIKELTGALDGASGAAQRTADIMGGAFNAVVAKFENNLENLRNAVLAPILEPLGEEITRLSNRLIAFSQSPEFDTLVENFTRIAEAGIKGFGEFIASVDFTDALARLVDFSTDVASNLATVARAFQITGDIIGGFGDLVSITLSSIKGVTASVAAALVEPLAVFDEGAKGIWLSLRAEAEISERSVGDSLNKLGDRFTGTSATARKFSDILAESGDTAETTSQRYIELAESLVPESFAAVARAAASAVDELRDLAAIPAPAKLSLGNLAKSADTATLSLSGLEKRLKDVRQALADAPRGSPEFLRFAQDAKVLEDQIKETKDAIEVAAGSNEKLAKSADRAAGSLRNQASAASQAGAAAGNLAQGNSQVSQSFGNIANQSSSTAIGLGNMTEAYLQQTLAAAGTAKSARDYMNALNAGFARYEDDERRIQQRIETLERMSAVEDEGLQRQRLYETQYGTTSRSLQRLIELEEAQNQTRSRGNEISQRGLDIERQRQSVAQAGALNYTQAGNQTEAPTPVGGRGGPAGVASRSAPIQITINQNGANAETIREIAPLIERELLRRGFLGR